ncbi:MAG: dTDP-glucose 4,6-dehydratase [Syntrophobacteraceae bacterium]
MKTILVTGGCGFIGSNFVLSQRESGRAAIINLDCLSYAANMKNLASLAGDPHYCFVKGDIADRDLVRTVLDRHRPSAVVNFAAETHVDRSIGSPFDFIQTNVVGTFQLIEETRAYWERLSVAESRDFRFLHISTDEVYGTLGPGDPPFSEKTPYAPNSPYAASKAASDHLVRACCHTYGLPAITTNCSNNYGPRQFPEKLIPLMILNAISGKPLPIYGDGTNIRDWLYVTDHCNALSLVLERGVVGETYNIGGHCERSNVDIVKMICGCLDHFFPESPHRPHFGLAAFVKDRPGHDWRYAVDCSKIEKELGWRPTETLESGLIKTVEWYLNNPDWVRSVQTGEYSRWIEGQYGLKEGH